LNIRFEGDQMQTSIAEIDRWTAEIKPANKKSIGK